MSRITTRAVALATTAALSLTVAVGTADAKVSKPEKKQNTAIKKAQRTGSSAGRAAKKAGAAAKVADLKAGNAAANAGTAIANAKKANDGVDGINKNVVPAALKALTDLQAGLLALKDGLTTVGAGLTTVGSGLQKLATFVGSDEYGIVQIGVGGTPIPGCFYETGNVPDNVQDAIVSGTCNIDASNAAAGGTLNVLSAIRSNESDGVAGGAAAGVAGIVSYTQGITQLGAGPASETTQGFGATKGNAALGGAPAVEIPLKSAPTSTTETRFPFGPISTDKLVDLATTANGFTGSPGATTVPAITDAGTLRSIKFTIRFNDLTPDANDPTA